MREGYCCNHDYIAIDSLGKEDVGIVKCLVLWYLVGVLIAMPQDVGFDWTTSTKIVFPLFFVIVHVHLGRSNHHSCS
jgi:hypothetical protein